MAPRKYYPQKIENKRIVNGKTEYFVKWVGYSSAQNTWEPVEYLTNNRHLIKSFEDKTKSQLQQQELLKVVRPLTNTRVYSVYVHALGLAFWRNMDDRSYRSWEEESLCILILVYPLCDF
jgi:hypothetical protein